MPKKNANPTAFEIARRSAGLTRKELSERSGIPLRTIEAYEQRKNDINLAAVGSIKRVSDVLGCRIEDIISKT